MIAIDLFAGGGGASEGIRLATGVEPIIAINHCRAAIDMHAANHPGTIHLQESVWDVPAGDLSGWDVYLDPPYAGATSYAVDLPRARVLRDAQDLRARGATVAVSEAVALDLRRWRAVDLTRPGGKPEWLTCSRWPRAAQVGLFEARA